MIAQLNDAKYAAVLCQYKPRPIHTEEDNQRAIDVLESLHTNDALTLEQAALAELLTTLIEKFEEDPVRLPPRIARCHLARAHGSKWPQAEGPRRAGRLQRHRVRNHQRKAPHQPIARRDFRQAIQRVVSALSLKLLEG